MYESKDGLILGNWGKDAILLSPKSLYRAIFPQLSQRITDCCGHGELKVLHIPGGED